MSKSSMIPQVATERKSFLPLRSRSTTVFNSSNIPTTSRPTTSVTTSMPLTAQHDTKSSSSLTIGNRVLVNGLKSGILRYIGSVQFARGVFCGVELDQPDGKHDGQVSDVRYFQCKTNHGIFVPYDKVVLATHERALTTQRPIGQLKPPIMTRSMTISSSSNNKPTQIMTKMPPATIPLPDIIPNASTSTSSTPTVEIIPLAIVTNVHEETTPTENPKSIVKLPLIPLDEPLEMTEADFTDSVSLILHQLQQESNLSSQSRCQSITISEEGTIDDLDEDSDADESDNKSIAESNCGNTKLPVEPIVPINEVTKLIPINTTLSIPENLTKKKINLSSSKQISSSNRSLASSTASINRLKIEPNEKKNVITQRKPNLPTPTPINKKTSERKLSMPLVTTSSTARKSSLVVQPKKEPLSSRKSIISLGSQSKLNHSLSASTSVNSSRSDLTSNNSRGPSRSIDFNSRKNSIACIDALEQQIKIQQLHIQSLETNHIQLKKQYQHLLNHFDLLCIINQYYLEQNEQNKQDDQIKLLKIRSQNRQMKISMKDLKILHKQELLTMHEHHQNQLQTIKTTHKQESFKFQQELETLSNEKLNLEIRCTSLQDQVDRFMEDMANSEYADPLLHHVETLEKDRTSLQTVLELRNQELGQLRTRLDEQIFERENQLALQKRIDMAENRNQDLICLLRNWQLNEKAVVVERDRLKEQIAQLERDNQQLAFERETLLYSLRQRSTTIAYIPTISGRPSDHRHDRARSFTCLTMIKTENQHWKRSSSMNFLFNR